MENDIIEKISEALHTPRRGLTPATRLADLIQDSIDVIELIAVLSSEYGIAVDSMQLSRMETVGDVVRYLVAHARNEPKQRTLKTF